MVIHPMVPSSFKALRLAHRCLDNVKNGYQKINLYSIVIKLS